MVERFAVGAPVGEQLDGGPGTIVDRERSEPVDARDGPARAARRRFVPVVPLLVEPKS